MLVRLMHCVVKNQFLKRTSCARKVVEIDLYKKSNKKQEIVLIQTKYYSYLIILQDLILTLADEALNNELL